jgi:hypothetical protein
MDAKRRIRLPSPAMAVALVALFVGLSGTGFAVDSTIVPLAKRALTADKATRAVNADNAVHALAADTAKKLGEAGAAALAAQAAQVPGPASTAAGLITIKTGPWSLNPKGEGNFTATCTAGQKAIGGGWSDPGNWSSSYQTLPTADGSGWTTDVYTSSGAPGPQSGSVYAICLK